MTTGLFSEYLRNKTGSDGAILYHGDRGCFAWGFKVPPHGLSPEELAKKESRVTKFVKHQFGQGLLGIELDENQTPLHAAEVSEVVFGITRVRESAGPVTVNTWPKILPLGETREVA